MLRALLIITMLITAPVSMILGNTDPIMDMGAQLAILGNHLQRDSTDDLREKSNIDFKKLLYESLQLPSSFDYPFAEVKTMSTILSEDKRVKLYTWVVPACNGEKYSFFGFVQIRNLKDNEVVLYELTDKPYPDNAVAELTDLSVDEWYGCVYYKVILKKYKKKSTYTLLGWRGNNSHTTRKIIDVLSIGNDNLRFGKPIFKTKENIKYRMVYEFNLRAVMSLNYNDDEKAIVMDHLSPREASLKGNYEYYGPDFTYDKFYFRKGSWILKENIEMNNKEHKTKGENVPLVKDKRSFQRQTKEGQ